MAEKDPDVIGPKLYEKLPDSLKTINSDKVFQRHLKELLSDNPLYKDQQKMGDLVECDGAAVRTGLSYPVSASGLKFMVRSPLLEAELGLLVTVDGTTFYKQNYKLALSNRETMISLKNEVYQRVATPELLSMEEWREFWVTWHGGRGRVGRGGDPVPFLDVELPDKPQIKYVVPGVGVHWKLELRPVLARRPCALMTSAPLAWVAAQDGRPPLGAVIGGYEEEPLTVIRAHHLGSLTPGKFVPSQGAFIGWDNNMHLKEEFETLVGYTAEWVQDSSGVVPVGALPAGHSEDGDALYVGRALHKGHLVLGTCDPPLKCVFITHGGKEVRKGSYEVLVCRARVNSRAVHVKGDLPRTRHHEPEAILIEELPPF